MSETIGYDEIVRMLKGAVARIRANQDALSKLDAATGDGDHGAAMGKAMGAVEKTLEEAEGAEIKTLLHDIGWNVMCIDGGSTATSRARGDGSMVCDAGDCEAGTPSARETAASWDWSNC